MLSMEAALRKDNVQPDPKGLGPIYSQNFLTYLKKNPHMNITAFGLNCAAPEDLIASLHGMFDKKAKVNNHLQFNFKYTNSLANADLVYANFTKHDFSKGSHSSFNTYYENMRSSYF